MKGIILAGGKGSRLYPVTIAISKQLLPVYDKPLIYYPLSTLLQLGIRDIAIITARETRDAYFKLLSDGNQLGINLEFLIQERPNGIAEVFIIAEQFIGDDDVCLILGDNVFYNLNYLKIRKEISNISGAIIFALYNNNPSQYGVIEFQNNEVITIEEKPKNPKSNYIIPGLYIYDHTVVNIAKSLLPSSRGEFEITDINNHYLKGKLQVVVFDQKVKWFDTGNPKDLLEASMFVKQEQKKINKYIACLEEISYRNGYINKQKIKESIHKYCNTEYGEYLKRLVNET